MSKPHHDILGPCQLDGNMTMTQDTPGSPPISPSMTLTHSTPDQVTPPLAIPNTSPIAMQNIQPVDDNLSILPLGLSTSPTSTLSSLSLESWSDLDNFLPYSMTHEHQTSPSSTTQPNLSQTPVHVTPPAQNSPQPQAGNAAQAIPVVTGHAPVYPQQQYTNRRTPCRTTVKRSNRAATALSLPNVMVTNHRSIFPKFNNLIDEILELDMHLGLHCKIWEDKENVVHANKIEEALEIHGIQYISTPRPKRRGGGAAITLIRDSPFVLTQLDPTCMSVDDSLEVCWGLLKPKQPTGPIKCIIVCSFYIPPNSRKKSALIEHISLNYFILKSQHPDAAFICGGDKNDLNVQLLLDINPSFRQLVTKPTYRLSVLDVLITDIGHYYLEPVIRPAVQPDNPTSAKPSDHRIAFAQTNTIANQPAIRETVSRITRPLTNDAISNFGNWIQQESWEYVYNGVDSSDMVDRLNFIINLNLDTHCPTKTIKISNLDGKFSSAAVKQASRRKNREYTKNGNSAKYKELKKEVKVKLKEAAVNFLEKQTNLVTAKNNSWLRHVKLLTARPGDQSQSTFTLPQHVEDNLTAIESSNAICEYFSRISQEYTPLNPASLPDHIKTKLSDDPCKHPHLADHIVYEGLKKGKKTCSVPGDIPIKILNEFLPELTAPVAAIYREAVASHTWPKSFKKEYHLPINKVPIPQSEDELRNLGLTPFFSKRLEWFLIQWIWPFISPHIDLDQLGGLPGCSVEHYLVHMLDFVHKNLDKNHAKPTAVLTGLVDFSKAFNRIDHNVIVTILADLNIPTCALRLIISYLSDRKMCVRYNGAESDEQDKPGGGPQGGLLTVILFDLSVNLAGVICPIHPAYLNFWT